MSNLSERLARMGLCALGHLGSPQLVQLVEREGPEWVWAQLRKSTENRWSRKAVGIDPEEILRATRLAGARFLIPDDPDWPAQLADLNVAMVNNQAGAPFGLWIKGADLPDTSQSVAIVGSRAPTQYGTTVAGELAAELSASGIPILSGLAFGIDAAAHNGALRAGGVTVGIVASGVDKPYPASNASLASLLVRRGAILSEAPPGTHPTKAAFLARNRLIAALSVGVVVVEAALRSGAKNTAAWASELGRVVMAAPGSVHSSLSTTPHNMIRSGQAVLVTGGRDVLEAVGPVGRLPEAATRGPDKPFDLLPEDAQLVREAIHVGEEATAGALARRAGLTMMQCLAALQLLLDEGWVEQSLSGEWRLPSRVG